MVTDVLTREYLDRATERVLWVYVFLTFVVFDVVSTGTVYGVAKSSSRVDFIESNPLMETVIASDPAFYISHTAIHPTFAILSIASFGMAVAWVRAVDCLGYSYLRQYIVAVFAFSGTYIVVNNGFALLSLLL